jgi:hypothetical protein
VVKGAMGVLSAVVKGAMGVLSAGQGHRFPGPIRSRRDVKPSPERQISRVGYSDGAWGCRVCPGSLEQYGRGMIDRSSNSQFAPRPADAGLGQGSRCAASAACRDEPLRSARGRYAARPARAFVSGGLETTDAKSEEPLLYCGEFSSGTLLFPRTPETSPRNEFQKPAPETSPRNEFQKAAPETSPRNEPQKRVPETSPRNEFLFGSGVRFAPQIPKDPLRHCLEVVSRGLATG